MKTESMTIAPSWEYAVEVYASVLAHPDASEEAKLDAKEELMRLARIVDNLNKTTPAD